MEDEKHHKKSSTWKAIALVLIALALWLAIYLLFFSESKRTLQSEKPEVSYRAVICEKNSQSPSEILTTFNPVSVSEKLNIVFRNNELNSLLFTYDGTYADNAAATRAENEIHTAYYRYIGKLGISVTHYSNTYSIIDNTMNMTLMASAKNLKMDSLPLFFLSSDMDIMKMPAESYESFYKNLGFTCKIE